MFNFVPRPLPAFQCCVQGDKVRWAWKWCYLTHKESWSIHNINISLRKVLRHMLYWWPSSINLIFWQESYLGHTKFEWKKCPTLNLVGIQGVQCVWRGAPSVINVNKSGQYMYNVHVTARKMVTHYLVCPGPQKGCISKRARNPSLPFLHFHCGSENTNKRPSLAGSLVTASRGSKHQ